GGGEGGGGGGGERGLAVLVLPVQERARLRGPLRRRPALHVRRGPAAGDEGLDRRRRVLPRSGRGRSVDPAALGRARRPDPARVAAAVPGLLPRPDDRILSGSVRLRVQPDERNPHPLAVTPGPTPHRLPPTTAPLPPPP